MAQGHGREMQRLLRARLPLPWEKRLREGGDAIWGPRDRDASSAEGLVSEGSTEPLGRGLGHPMSLASVWEAWSTLRVVCVCLSLLSWSFNPQRDSLMIQALQSVASRP